jgi:hypothetical protein
MGFNLAFKGLIFVGCSGKKNPNTVKILAREIRGIKIPGFENSAFRL